MGAGCEFLHLPVRVMKWLCMCAVTAKCHNSGVCMCAPNKTHDALQILTHMRTKNVQVWPMPNTQPEWLHSNQV